MQNDEAFPLERFMQCLLVNKKRQRGAQQALNQVGFRCGSCFALCVQRIAYKSVPHRSEQPQVEHAILSCAVAVLFMPCIGKRESVRRERLTGSIGRQIRARTRWCHVCHCFERSLWCIKQRAMQNRSSMSYKVR